MAGTTNFLVFNESNDEARTFNDSEYAEATQRLNGVTPGMAISRLHNKLYLQGTAMARAIAEAITANGDNCMDNDIPAITASINKLIDDRAAASSAFSEYTKTINAPMFNKRDIITTSGTYTAPVTGWYKITVKGGGGGGGGGKLNGTNYTAGAGGGEGGTTITYEHLTAGDGIPVTIGAGGNGGAAGGSSGTNGGTSSVTIGLNTHSATGGKQGALHIGGAGGIGTINGCAGTQGGAGFGSQEKGGSGGGSGGTPANASASPTQGTQGGGGGGGCVYGSGRDTFAGAGGGDGYVWFEYFDSSLNS